jgi:Trk K+ transport system NAD-binding subunit
MNLKIRVLMRLFEQRIAQKLAGAMDVDAAFSSSALAAPVVAAMSMDAKVLSSLVIGGVPHVVCELRVAQDSSIAGKRIDQIEMGYTLRVLSRAPASGTPQTPPTPATTIAVGDVLVIHTAASQLATLAAAGCAAAR